MSTHTEFPAEEPVIVMSRVYDAPRALVWKAMTEPAHVAAWWGGPGSTNPVCEMDVRPGGRWNHVMRFPDGFELAMHFVFVDVEPPRRLVWRAAEAPKRPEEPPSAEITVQLDEVGKRTRWTMTARFASLEAREAARRMGFTKPIEASSDRLVAHLEGLVAAG